MATLWRVRYGAARYRHDGGDGLFASRCEIKLDEWNVGVLRFHV